MSMQSDVVVQGLQRGDIAVAGREAVGVAPVFFTYRGANYSFPASSGVFICNTTATDGTGTQSNGLWLGYLGSDDKTVTRYRNVTIWVPMGRTKPVKELGQYSFRSMAMQYGWPPVGMDYTGNPYGIRADQVEALLDALVDTSQAGQFVQVQDAKGRVLIGEFSPDPTITDLTSLPGWQRVAFGLVEIGT